MAKVKIKDDSDSFSLNRICDSLRNSAGTIMMVSDETLDLGSMHCALINTTMDQRPTHVTLLIDGDVLVDARVTRWFIYNHEFRMVVEWAFGAASLAFRIEEDQEAQILPPGALAL